MADFYTHYSMAKTLSARMELPSVRRHTALFYWGAQGPDPLFFRSVLRGSPLHALGNRLHSERTGTFFFALAEAAGLLPDCDRAAGEAYLFGFLCHYALDCRIHPYVYFLQHARERAGIPGNHHCAIETAIDRMLAAEQGDAPLDRFPIAKLFAISRDERRIAAGMLRHAIRAAFGSAPEPEELEAAFADMLRFERILFNTPRRFYLPAAAAERILGRPGAFTAHFKCGRAPEDLFNRAGSPWTAEAEPDVTRTDSLPELIASSVDLAQELIARFDGMLQSGALYPVDFPLNFEGLPAER